MTAWDFEFLEDLAGTNFVVQGDVVGMSKNSLNLIAPVIDVCDFTTFDQPDVGFHNSCDLGGNSPPVFCQLCSPC